VIDRTIVAAHQLIRIYDSVDGRCDHLGVVSRSSPADRTIIFTRCAIDSTGV
jgi:hypothetical protein